MGFWKELDKELGKFFQSGSAWGAIFGAFNPEVRSFSEEGALKIRDLIEDRFPQIDRQLSDKESSEMWERIFGSVQGAAERTIEQKFDNQAVIAFLEKAFIDVPDYASSILFADEEELDKRRAARSRQLIHEGQMTFGQAIVAEKEMQAVYMETREAIQESLPGLELEPLSEEEKAFKWEKFLELLKRPYDPEDAALAQTVHERGKEFRDWLIGVWEKLDKTLLALFGWDPNPELADERRQADQELRELKDEIHHEEYMDYIERQKKKVRKKAEKRRKRRNKGR